MLLNSDGESQGCCNISLEYRTASEEKKNIDSAEVEKSCRREIVNDSKQYLRVAQNHGCTYSQAKQ